MVGGLRDENHGINRSRVEARGVQEATGRVFAQVQSGDTGRGYLALAQTDGLSRPLEHDSVEAKG
jgi:hypothetical protein